MRRASYIPVFYVVTRAGRRTSPSDYWTWDEATKEASRLRARLQKWNDPDAFKVEIVKTTSPESII
tara:strand:+ start:374 stop:571 length:198 start_codon:yes stop_codon:yes gene_type:complete